MQSNPRPSYPQGFAHFQAESEYPEQWRGIAAAFTPFLGNDGPLWYDWSGLGNHAAYNGFWDFDAPIGHVAWLNGINNWGEASADCALFERTDPFSVCVWINMRALGPGTVTIYTKEDVLRRGHMLIVDLAGTVYFRLISNFGVEEIRAQTPGGTVAAGNWYYIVATYDGSSVNTGLTLYVDGVDATAVTLLGPLTLTIRYADPLFVGARPGPLGLLAGLIADFRVYDYELTPDEVTALYENPKGMYIRRSPTRHGRFYLRTPRLAPWRFLESNIDRKSGAAG